MEKMKTLITILCIILLTISLTTGLQVFAKEDKKVEIADMVIYRDENLQDYPAVVDLVIDRQTLNIQVFKKGMYDPFLEQVKEGTTGNTWQYKK